MLLNAFLWTPTTRSIIAGQIPRVDVEEFDQLSEDWRPDDLRRLPTAFSFSKGNASLVRAGEFDD